MQSLDKTFMKMKAGNTNRKFSHMAMGMLAVITTYSVVVHSGITSAARTSPMNLTAKQIAEKAAPLCRTLAESNATLHETVEARTIMGADNKPHEAWVVECDDPHDNHFVRTVWDARTGDLIFAIHMAERSTKGWAPKLTAAQAADVAWRRMGELGVARLAPHWQISERPQLTANSWRVVMKAKDISAIVVFDSNTHNLVYSMIKRNPLVVRPN